MSFLDARAIPKNSSIKTDVCVIGAGAAGITLAREFMGATFETCLVESGGLEWDFDTQMLYQGESVGVPYFPLEVARLRFFGGTTNHWGGACRPLEEEDLEARPWVPKSGWPLKKSNLDPFYERAHTLCQLGPYSYENEYWQDPDLRPLFPLKSKRVLTKIFQNSPPTRFGMVYREELSHPVNVKIILNANVKEIETTGNGQKVTRVNVACLNGTSFWILPRFVILAAGGIENPRLLLLSNRQQKAGLGNQHDLVGRFFMEHPGATSGIFILTNPYKHNPQLYLRHPVNGVDIFGALTIDPEIQKQEELLNYCGVFVPEKNQESEGVAAVRNLLGALRQGEVPKDFWKHVGNILANLDDVADATYKKLKKTADPLKLNLWNQLEQGPNYDSRVSLGQERDALGLLKVRFDWRLSDAEKRTMVRSQEIIGQELARAGIGRLQAPILEDKSSWTSADDNGRINGPEGSFHHMGTTRMHENPKEGVVDEHCRVHGIANLFIAGSSVFPSCGFVNPTLTIIALAIRLADHIKIVMAEE